MNRRDIMKFFAAGALIGPAAATAPIVRLVEPPKVEPVEMIMKPLGVITSAYAVLTDSRGNTRRFDFRVAPTVIKPGDSIELRTRRPIQSSPMSDCVILIGDAAVNG
jgi:hypothetical protein